MKSKKTDSQPSPWRHRAMVAAAGLGAAGLAAATIIGARPALRKQFLAEIKALGKGGGHALERQSSLPQQAVDQARQVAMTLRAQGIDPATARIAVSGTGGTGKTTLTRALSQELGMTPLMMDDVGKSMSGRDLVSWVKKNPIRRGVIAEQTHLLSQVDPDKFDAVIRVHKPMSQVKKQILDRGRGAAQLEGYDYDKLNRSITTAFDNLGAEKITPVTGIDIKIKPGTGFGADQMLRRAAEAKGVKTEGLSRHGLVLAAANGKRPTGGGVIPYFRKGRMALGAGVVGGAGVGGAAVANRLGQRAGVEKVAISNELAQRVADERLWDDLTASGRNSGFPETRKVQMEDAAKKLQRNRMLMAARGHRQDQGVALKTKPKPVLKNGLKELPPRPEMVTRRASSAAKSGGKKALESMPMGRKTKGALAAAGLTLAALAAAKIHSDMSPKKYANAQTPGEADRDIGAATAARSISIPLDDEMRSDASGRQKKGRGVPEWVASLTGKKS